MTTTATRTVSEQEALLTALGHLADGKSVNLQGVDAETIRTALRIAHAAVVELALVETIRTERNAIAVIADRLRIWNGK